MEVINQTYEMKADPTTVFEALTNPDVIKNWSGGPAEMDDKVGTKFALFGGQITGTNTEVVANQKLVQEWYGGDWKSPSKVTFTLLPSGETTTVELLHEAIPAGEGDKFSEGWQSRYLGPMQKMFAA